MTVLLYLRCFVAFFYERSYIHVNYEHKYTHKDMFKDIYIYIYNHEREIIKTIRIDYHWEKKMTALLYLRCFVVFFYDSK
jgi:hypothetical protein